MRQTAINWLERERKKTLLDLRNAIQRNCTLKEHDNLQRKVCVIEWLLEQLGVIA